jgi:hypothetical protein
MKEKCLTTAPNKALYQAGQHRIYPEQYEEGGHSNTEAERDRPLLYLAAAYGPHGIKHAVKEDPGEEPYERKMPDRYRIRRLRVFRQNLKPHIQQREE